MNGFSRAVLVAAAACAALAGCTSSPPAATCESRENQLVSEIDAVGQDLLGGVVYRTSGYSGCEDKGQVDPYVDFVVPRWSSLSEAIARLRERGWELEEVKGGFAPQSTFHSADAQWIAIAYVSGADDGVTIVVMSRGQFLADVKPVGGP